MNKQFEIYNKIQLFISLHQCQDRLHATLQKQILNFSGLYRGIGTIDSLVKVCVLGLQDKNNLTFTGKSILTPSPMPSTIMFHWSGKRHR